MGPGGNCTTVVLLSQKRLPHPAHVDVPLAQHVHRERRLVEQGVGHSKLGIRLHQEIRRQPSARVCGRRGEIEGGAANLEGLMLDETKNSYLPN